MPAPIPLFNDPLDWRQNPGAELASVGTAHEDEPLEGTDSRLGLVYEPDSDKWVAPRLSALNNKVLSVADLDDEELMRGQVRDSDGRFRSGPSSRKIPREFHDELVRRIIDVGTERIRKSYLSAIDVLTDVVTGESVDVVIDNRGNRHEVPASMTLRVQTAKYLIERLAGKTPERVEHAVALKPWEIALKTIVTAIPAEGVTFDAETIEDAEEVEDD